MAKQPLLKWVPALLWFGAVAYFSLLPKADVPELLSNINDKAIHLGIYFLGVLLLFIPVKGNRLRWLVGVWIFSALIELLQAYFIDGRTGDVGDLVANAAGIVLAAGWVRFRGQ